MRLVRRIGYPDITKITTLAGIPVEALRNARTDCLFLAAVQRKANELQYASVNRAQKVAQD